MGCDATDRVGIGNGTRAGGSASAVDDVEGECGEDEEANGDGLFGDDGAEEEDMVVWYWKHNERNREVMCIAAI